MAAKDAVHVLERGVLGLGQHEPDPDEATHQEGGKEDVGAPGPGLEHGRDEEGDGEVIQPVGVGADGDAAGPNGEGEDLRDHHPARGAPAEAEARDVDPNQDHGGPAGVHVVGPVVPELGDDDADRQDADEHDDGACHEHGFAAQPVDEEHGGQRADHENRPGHTRGQESDGARRETEALEDVGGVVDNCF